MNKLILMLILYISSVIGLTIAFVYILNWNINDSLKALSLVIVATVQIFFLTKILLDWRIGSASNEETN